MSSAADAKADREASDPQEDEHTADTVPVVDGDEHRDAEPKQGKTGHKPEGDKALPAIVDRRTVIRPRMCRPPQGAQASFATPSHASVSGLGWIMVRRAA